MLPVLFTLAIPAGFGVPAALTVAILLAVGRTAAMVRAGGGRVSFAEALKGDGWFLAVLAAVVAVGYFGGWLRGRLELPLHSYGLLLALAFILGVWLAQREARRRGQDAEAVGDMAFWALLAALLGSQLFYVFLNLDEFTGERFYADPPFQHLPRILILWRIGLVFYGGFIGAALAVFLFMRRRRLSFLPYADTIIPSVAFGHFLGRLGCFCAGCCWGSRADPHLPWAVRFPPGSNVYEAFAGDPVRYPAEFFSLDRHATAPLHPAQLYEAFGELALFLALVFLVRPRKRFHGQVLAAWLILYAILRAAVEMVRGDLARPTALGLNSGQWTSVAILLVGLTVWFRSPRALRPAGAAV
ncbi:MAG TPA: prolipoprotein diacylglyceryl transferase [Anaeromyxobacter sp.]|nr:prolipoprotein diacylglyceryl transferase [Anaeromyxobacter sp.]